MKYAQCKLERPLRRGGLVTQTTWLPIKYAVLGKVLSLKDGLNWTSGWKVVEVGPREDRPDWRRSVRDHRTNTGDDLPRISA